MMPGACATCNYELSGLWNLANEYMYDIMVCEYDSFGKPAVYKAAACELTIKSDRFQPQLQRKARSTCNILIIMKLTFYIVVLAALAAAVCAYPSKRDDDDDEEHECPTPDEGCCLESDLDIPEEHEDAYSPKQPIYGHLSIVSVGSPVAYHYICYYAVWYKF